jgi:hypothetical protein
MHLLMSLASVLLWASGITVNASVEPWGHWEGSITGQFGTVRIELDLTRTPDGKPSATFSVPERKMNGLPMISVTVEGKTIAFEPAAIGARFKGDLSADGAELSGLFEAAAGSMPVTLTRKGDAHITAAPKNAAVSGDVEGTWNGTLHVDGGKRIVLTMVNQPDHTSIATIVSVDEAGLTLPAAVRQDGKALTIEVPAVSSSYAGTLSADGQELVGTYTTSEGFDLPLTMRRGGIEAGKK